MISVNKNELAIIQQTSTAVWQWFKKYYHMQDTDSDWQAVIDDLYAVYEQYHTSLCRQLLLTYLGALERHVRRYEIDIPPLKKE